MFADHKLAQGRPKQWLQRIVPLLHSTRRETLALVAFHFCMEGLIKKSQERLEMFEVRSSSFNIMQHYFHC